jgi:putative ABC transport system permease protein
VKPPELVNKLLEWLLAPHLLETIMGDLHEEFEYQVKRIGEEKARWLYWRQALGFIKPRYIKRQRSTHPSTSLISHDMISNYFKIAFRNLIRQKAYSVINILGLAMGMAVAISIGLWVEDELSFNKYHKNYNSIARVMRHITVEGETFSDDYLPYELADELKINYGQHFKNLVVSWPTADHVLSNGKITLSRKGTFMEKAAPEVFSLTMLKGSRAGLQDPNSVLLAEATAKALFGDENPVGKFVRIDNRMDTKVTGVYQNLPRNTQFHELQFISPLDLYISANAWIKEQGWTNNFLHIYVDIESVNTLKKSDFDNISSQISNAQSRHEKTGYKSRLFLHPMRDWHLFSDFKNGQAANSPLRFVWLVGGIGVFILLLACINFMNLSTARSEKRSKEVGVRKAIGSLRTQLIIQFFSESFLTVVFAFVLALVLAYVALPWFNHIAVKQLSVPWDSLWFWMVCLAFILITSFVAGSYPALYLSSFKPVTVLKGALRTTHFAPNPRKLLVCVQFIVSITLTIGTIGIYNQIIFTKSRPVGYTRAGLIMLEQKTKDYAGKIETLRNELKSSGVVTEIAESEGKVTEIGSNISGFNWKGKSPLMKDNFGKLSVSAEYGKTVGWQIISGRDLSGTIVSDSSGMILNEAAVKYMGLQNPVGEMVTWIRKGRTYKILGVVRDMVMTSPYGLSVPTIFVLDPYYNTINIRLNPAVPASEAIPKIEAIFKKHIPGAPFDYKFADAEYNSKFAAEERIGNLAFFFTALAIFISCLGLFGLASFTAEQRTKEIGIRKVLGATIFDLWRLLSKDFVILTMISLFFAAPVAFYFMEQWMQKYTYRTEISWWTFVITGTGALLVTLATVSYKAIRAALLDPVKSLKTE